MAEVTELMSGASEFFINLGLIIAVVLIAVVIGFLIFKTFLFYKKWMQFECRIFFQDGAGNTQLKKDSGGIFKDSKTKNQLFFVRKLRTSLKPDNIPFVIEGRKKIVYFIQTGEKNLRPIKWDWDYAKMKPTILEEDINWGTQAYEREKKLLELGIWEKVLPFLIIVVPTICIMIILLAFFKKLDVLVEFGRLMATSAQQLAEASAGTTIIGG